MLRNIVFIDGSYYLPHVKTLYVIRHAKSSWDNPLLTDFDRPLNPRGLRDAPAMGKRLKEQHVMPDLMLTSPAKRALATCLILAEEMDYAQAKIRTDKKLYHADTAQIFRVVQALADQHHCVWMIGHNPGLTDFVNLLADAEIDNIPTTGVVACSIQVSSWSKVQQGKGSVIFFDYPKRNRITG